ncbi:MAG TPA: NADPH-dependent FMN reductase [Polyangiaceae bacterium]|nr:NADPH-dependent FMN reductase [Polyangiaceae bacterium]
MATIIGISGSLRKASFNAALLRSAVELAPPELTIEVGSIRDIPLYDGDVEAASGIPAPVAALKDRVAAAAGLLLVTPEYNASIPGVFKNAIDWLSRPNSDIARVFGTKPVGVIGATPGPAGTRLSQTAWLPVLRQLGTQPWFGKSLFLANAGQAFDESGKLTDPKLQQLLRDYLAGFAKFVTASAAAAR